MSAPTKEALPLHTELILPSEEVAFIPDRVKKALKRLQASPFDTEAWSVLIRDAQTKSIQESRNMYERLVAQFPTSGRYWKVYVETEMKAKNYERVENLFQRCLVKVLHMDLWKLYLSYIKETKSGLPSFREKMARAYDFALEKIGMDVSSYQIWVDYIAFLKSVEAVGSYAENQRITAVRKVYQRGIINPMMNIELLWKDYVNYENSINPMLARKMTEDRSREYGNAKPVAKELDFMKSSINPMLAKKMTEDRSREYGNAKRVAKELDFMTRGLNRNQMAVPPCNSADEMKQIELWKKFIQFEKKNPMRTEEHAVVTKRVMFAYEQSLLCLAYHPDIWYEAASFLEQSSKLLTEKGDPNAGKMFAEETASIFERAINGPMKKNTLTYFAYADFEEGRLKYEKVHSIYKKFIEITDIDPTLAFVQYMKFARRAEGIKAARIVFKMAREDTRAKYHAYVAAALMEFYCSKDQTVALRIFELGLKKYGDDVDYVKCYLDFMSNLNDDNNTRVLYEKVLSSGLLSTESCIDVWSKFTSFESQVGDLTSIIKVDKRRTQILESDASLQGKETAVLIDRYKYHDLYPCSCTELKALGYVGGATKSATTTTTPTTDTTKETTETAEAAKKRQEVSQPNIDMMIPFKPRLLATPGTHIVNGGVFPPPPAASRLLTQMPPPICFHGPFVKIDVMLDRFSKMELPESPVFENGMDSPLIQPDTAPVFENGMDGPLIQPDTGTQFTIDAIKGAYKRKKKGEKEEEIDSDEEEAKVAPPLNDLYRSRLQKRVK